MKPDWSNAPTWANWLACSFKGYWIWFSHKPRAMMKTVSWRTHDVINHDAVCAGNEYTESSPYRNWVNTLEKKPKEKP